MLSPGEWELDKAGVGVASLTFSGDSETPAAAAVAVCHPCTAAAPVPSTNVLPRGILLAKAFVPFESLISSMLHLSKTHCVVVWVSVVFLSPCSARLYMGQSKLDAGKKTFLEACLL